MTIGTLTRRTTLLGAAAGAAIAALAAAASADTMTLKFSTMEPPQGPMVNCFTLPLLEELKAETGGQIEIETYMGGTGFAHPLRQYEQVARGVMDISQGVLSYTPGQFSMTEVATMPLLVEDAEVVSRAINKIAPEYLADEFKDIHLMAVLVTPPLFVHTRDAATSLDDLAGQRIRSTGSGANAFLEALGAVPVQMPAPAVYENLQTGVIDGALSEFLALRSFRIGEVAEHHLLINTTAALLFLGMNKTTLAGMPDDVQELIRTKYSGPEVGARASACWNELGAGVVEDLTASGHSFLEVSDADRARAEGIAAEITEAYIAELEGQGKPAQAFYDALMAEIDAQKMN
jgi:TRAP-type C4-dicarboxylate transport system substrate-binding protein